MCGASTTFTHRAYKAYFRGPFNSTLDRMSPPQHVQPLFGADIYADLREKWRHEDELINQRVTWLLSSQAFLLTAFGVLANLRLSSPLQNIAGNWYDRLVTPTALAETFVPLIAFFTLAYLGKAISAAVRAMSHIKQELYSHICAGRVPIGITVDVLPKATYDGAAAPTRMVAGFTTTWLALYFYELARIFGFLQ